MTAITQPTVLPPTRTNNACMPGLRHDFNVEQAKTGRDRICANCGLVVTVWKK